MKRDLDLVRKILFEVEKSPTPWGWVNLQIPGYSDEEISYHVKLLADAGLVQAKDLSSTAGFSWKPTALTWEGHEFLDAARNETVWNRTKEEVKQKGGAVSFEVLKHLLIKGVSALFGV
jgi:hypothetical protein